MGEQSPSDSGYQAASGQVSYRKSQKARERRKQEEAMMSMAEDENDMEKASATQIDESNKDAVANQKAVGRRASGFYVRSSGGSIVRSATGGNAVLTSAGSRALRNIRAGFDSDTKGYMKNRTTISSDDNAYSSEAERPQETIIDPIKTAGLSSAARKLTGQSQVGRGQRRFIRTV